MTHTDTDDITTGELLPNVHPGEILLEDFLEPMGITKNKLATSIGVPATRIGEIVKGDRSITADTDIRLALQNAYDLEEAHRAGHYDDIPGHAA